MDIISQKTSELFAIIAELENTLIDNNIPIPDKVLKMIENLWSLFYERFSLYTRKIHEYRSFFFGGNYVCIHRISILWARFRWRIFRKNRRQHMQGFERALQEYESRMFDPFADEEDAEEMQDRADDLGNLQFDRMHEEGRL